MLALVNGRPELLSLKQYLRHFLNFRREVVARRTAYELRQAESRAHILEGFAIALDNHDRVISIIRSADDTPAARQALIHEFNLSERQSQAILDMRLRALTGLERQRVLKELEELRNKITNLREILESDELIL